MTPAQYLDAARVPHSLEPQSFGLWTIERREAPRPDLCIAAGKKPIGWQDYTLLRRATLATLHRTIEGEQIVMEDSQTELKKHLPIWLAARGRVLITGLGLGCVVRGLLANPLVERIDVVELDRQIIDVVGAEFYAEDRVHIYRGDALKTILPGPWDFAWHDLWTEGTGLAFMHARLIHRFAEKCPRQGAWSFPRAIARVWPAINLGVRRRRPNLR